ncbi:putative 3-phenylpropionic acid transporter [bioreactor metagenome]|uniref:Putative 3-phenylpropionic acid transporter n=1 Tax=bioreactor metagenome TaxID=1076179 RepID=A0A644VYI4_9ZZZZ
MKEKNTNRLFFALYFFFWAAENCLGPYLGVYYKAIGLTGMKIGIVNGAFSVAVIVASLLIGAVGDKLGNTKRLLLFLLAGMIAGTAFLFVSRTFTLILIAVSLYGFSGSPVNGIADKILMDHLQDKPESFGVYRLGGTIGAGIGIIAAGLLITVSHFSFLFYFYWLSLLICFTYTLRIPVTENDRGMEKSRWSDYIIIVKNKSFIPIYITMMIWGFTEVGSSSFQALHIVACGFKSSYTSVFVTFSLIGEGIGFVLIPHLMNKIKWKHLLAFTFLLQFFKIGTMTLLRVLPLPVVIFFQFTGGGAFAIIYSIITQAISASYPSKVSCSAQTLKLVANKGIGLSCGSLMFGYLYENYSLTVGYGILTVISIVFAVFLFLSSRRGKDGSRTPHEACEEM